MIDAVGNPKSLLLLGGSSDIALAIADEYLAAGPLRVVVAARPSVRRDAAAARLRQNGATVSVVDFDAVNTAGHEKALDEAFAGGDIDVAVIAFGLLGDPEEMWQDQIKAVELATVNYTAAVSAGVIVGEKMKAQGFGRIIALSSVAGERVRRSNFVYGSSKAGFDGFYMGLGEALKPAGVSVTVVRPGMVRTKMTDGLDDAPMTITAEEVARIAVKASRKGKDLVWAPAQLRFVMSALRHVPRPIFRKLPI
ncbi:decaprenylphospho-beta-D-erythro-pentofuranosid-2-ulose 2-reductase [Hoyosella rhizosphaerae]|uniref:Decaprenylphospho-beta-D-erythro-pentofuranosid-2-ulose 2-reductase n=1 Tax=Hoyosella rhizosphaerae TaxID=1755582 RepID=A0A916UIN1_9ACTN|nr:decaprenylphospho-beta-D-erythro-pentofuranosid-2-ulose 2-reductase [Hoyosella rhizosphaerae]MBN4925466.1 decaprenylphospho-beta-D-erythro-pentofuranosid-2-ulose 2-reductase [Hoyosella rhizosphaerae]GGC74957.1 decaprenylphospho-beta-D-erythro-pentofuranosid-2-ulose 2-reductase [Hoyosella rhizosphaerae]